MKVLNSFTGVSRELNVMFMPGYGHFFNQASSYCFIQNVTIQVIEVGVEGVETTVVEAEDEAVGVEAADHIIVDVPAVKVQEMSTHHKMKAAVMRTAMKKLKVRDKMVAHVVVEAVAEDLGAIGDGQGERSFRV